MQERKVTAIKTQIKGKMEEQDDIIQKVDKLKHKISSGLLGKYLPIIEFMAKMRMNELQN